MDIQDKQDTDADRTGKNGLARSHEESPMPTRGQDSGRCWPQRGRFLPDGGAAA